MDKELLELQAEIKASQESRTNLEKEIAELKKSVETPEQKAEAAKQVEAKEKELAEMKAAMETLNTKFDEVKLRKGDNEPTGIMAAITTAIKSDAFKAGAREVISKKGASFAMDVEVKVDTSTIVTPVSNTQMMPGVYSDPNAADAFLDLFSTQTIPTGKSVIGYIDASFTDNTGYAEEMVALTAANGASAEEKTRALAKIGTFMPFSAEMIEDNATVLTWAQQQCIRAIRAKVDTELWSGAGADTTGNKNKIYGIKTQGSTAFDATIAGVKYEKANLADLAAACVAQVEVQSKGVYAPTTVVLHPADYAELAGQKNTLGNYLNILPGGAMVLHGLEVRKSVKVNKGEMAVLARPTLMLADKRVFTIEIERKPNTDSYILWIYWRGQGLVTSPDKLANIYVANIATALAAIEKPTV